MGNKVIPAETSRSKGVSSVAGNWRQEYGDWAAIPIIVITTRTLWPERVHKASSKAHPGLGIRWGTYVFIVSGDTGPDLS